MKIGPKIPGPTAHEFWGLLGPMGPTPGGAAAPPALPSRAPMTLILLEP